MPKKRKRRIPTKMTSREVAAMKHAISRAKERYGVTLDEFSYRSVIKLITSGETEFVRKQSNTRHLHWVEWEGTRMLAIYYPQTKKRRAMLRTFASVELAEEKFYAETH